MGRTPELTGESHVSRALMALYADDLAAAREHVAVATAAAGAGSDAGRAFTLYAEGEVLASSDPVTATARLREAAAEAGRIGAGQVSKVARLALLARLVRDGATEEARSLRPCSWSASRYRAFTPSTTVTRASLRIDGDSWACPTSSATT